MRYENRAERARHRGFLVLRETLLICAAISLLFPLVYMLICSGKSKTELTTNPFSLPSSWAQIVENFTSVFTGEVQMGKITIPMFTPYLTILKNQIILVLFALVFMIGLAVPIGYALGRRTFRGKGAYMLFIVFTQTVPLFSYILPFYYMMDMMGMTNNLVGIGLIFSATSMPTSIIFLRGFFSTLPGEVEEAAEIDGAGEFRRFFLIVLPMAKGFIGAIALIQFMGYWNEFAISNLLITDAEMRTISISVMLTSSGTGEAYPTYTYALLVMSALPSLLFFTLFNKTITRGGLAMGSLKG